MLSNNFGEADFDVIENINLRFPNEQSLATIEEHIASIKDKIRKHDEEISIAVRSQTTIEQDGKEALDNATAIIQKLMQRIHEMKNQAKKSEQTVNDITCDIKQLDNAKRNLTSAIIMLNNLHILVESVEKLKEICANDKNEYKQVASILASIQDVLKFSDYKDIPQINLLSKEINDLSKNIAERISNDFKSIFLLPKNSISKEDARLIAEACLVVSLLEDKVKNDLIGWFLDLQLVEYGALFKDSHIQVSSLFSVDKRYAWFKKHLLEFEEKYGYLFPPPWQMSERMAIEFCKKTEASLSRIMKTYPNEVKLDSLVFAMTKTTAFESLLVKRFKTESLAVGDDKDLKDDHSFEGMISVCFEPFFYVFIESQEQKVQKLFEQFVDEHQKNLKSSSAKKVSQVFATSNKLFLQYKESLVQCVQLSNKSIFVDLHELFKRYLREYAEILKMHLKNFTPNSMVSLNKFSSSDSSAKMFSVATSGAAGLLQSLLREDIFKSKIEPSQICSVILTADYCLETSQQLEKKLCEKIDPSLACKIDLKPELEKFNELIYWCVHLLIQYLEFGCEPGFSLMTKTQWSTAKTPAGHSPFVTDIMNSLECQVPLMREYLKEGRKYFVQMCNKFITVFTQKFITNLFRCKLLGQSGAEQLLLDTHILKDFLIKLPCINSEIKSAPATYTKAAIKGMSKAEMVLKVVLVPHDNVDSFIESYFKLMPDSNEVEFQHVLDLKGIKRSELNVLLDAYNTSLRLTLE